MDLIVTFVYLYTEGIHRFLARDIVRVGGRSNSEILKQFNLRQLASSPTFKRLLPNQLRNAYRDVSWALNNTDIVVDDLSQVCQFVLRFAHMVLQWSVSF